MELNLPDEETMLELARRRSGGHPVGDEIGQRDLGIIREAARLADETAAAAEEATAAAEQALFEDAAEEALETKFEDEEE